MRGNQIVRKLLGIRAKQERNGDGGHIGRVRKSSLCHLGSCKDAGKDEGCDPAGPKVGNHEPSQNFHGNDVAQVKGEEQRAGSEQVHVLRCLPQGPEILHQLGLQQDRQEQGEAWE